MASEQDHLAAIVVSLQTGRTPKEISEFLKLNDRTVYRVGKALGDQKRD